MQMRVFRCRLCGESFIGGAIPTHCPFCGAPAKHIIPAEKWVKGQDKASEVSEVAGKDLETALGLEVKNSGFYQSASKAAGNEYLMAMFKRLSKVELEHAKVISKIISPPEWQVKEEPVGSDQENIRNAIRKEESATRFYGQCLARATDPRIREIFQILTEVEATHTALLSDAS